MPSNKIIPSLLATVALAQAATTTTTATTTTHPLAGYTLSNGGYVCNPAHYYPGATCPGGQATPTLSYYSTTASTTTHPLAGYTLSNGGYVCNPAHYYPGATCPGGQATPTLSYYSTSSQTTTLVTSVRTTTPAASPATVTVTVTACPSSASSVASTASTATPPASSSSSPSSPSSPSSTCPLTLTGKTFEYPHLIVSSTSNANTGSTLYSPIINPTTTSFFNFDIPASLSGKTCDVIFSLPSAGQLQTSSFNLSGTGSLIFSSLKSAAVQNAAVPATAATLNTWSSVAPGQQFTVASGPCAAGQTVGYSIAADGSRALTYFQDYNPCPIGLYVVAR